MSQITIKSTCKYIFIFGKNKNKPCNKNCRGEYCNNHKQTKKVYKQKWYIQKKQIKLNSKVETKKTEIKNIDTIISNINDTQQLQIILTNHINNKNNFKNNYIYIFKKIIGCKKNIKAFDNTEIECNIQNLTNLLLGKCTCKTSTCCNYCNKKDKITTFIPINLSEEESIKKLEKLKEKNEIVFKNHENEMEIIKSIKTKINEINNNKQSKIDDWKRILDLEKNIPHFDLNYHLNRLKKLEKNNTKINIDLFIESFNDKSKQNKKGKEFKCGMH